MSYNPSEEALLKSFAEYIGIPVEVLSGPNLCSIPASNVEAPIDPTRFDDIEVAARYAPGQYGKKIDLVFGNIDLDDADDFFRYLGTEEGLADLTVTILATFVQAGTMSAADALAILLS